MTASLETTARRLARLTRMAIVVALAGCVPDYGFAPATTNDGSAASPDGGDGGASDGSTPVDGSHEASPPPPPPAPHTLATVGGVAAASGNAQQRHILYVGDRYWLFYIDDDAALIKTASSPDLATWSPGATIKPPVSNGAEGRNFSVATANVGGVDVVHLVLAQHSGATRTTAHLRATLAQGAITFGAWVSVVALDVDDGACDPDGPSVAIGSDGFVHDASGWYHDVSGQYCDFNVFRSTAPDTGAAFATSFLRTIHLGSGSGDANSHELISLSQGAIFGAWQNEDATLFWSATSPSGWKSSANVMPSANQSRNDWSLCKRSDTDIHAVRRKNGAPSDTEFDHMRFDGANWSVGGTLAPDAGVRGSGVVVMTDGTSVLLFAIGADAANSIRYAKWSGGTWTPWQTLFGTPAVRNFLSGVGGEPTSRPVVMWTEGAAPPYRIVGADVRALLQ